jgi:ParB family transcriptional regulator, chromosome partitioning protein
VGRRSGLGKGLGALIPATATEGEDQEGPGAQLRDVLVTQVQPNPFQPRSHFDEAALETLTTSVTEVGVLQPVLLREVAPDQYELIAGERRWRAAQRAGLTSIPALVRPADSTESLEHALVENLHRENLNPLEEAAAYQQLLDEFGLKQDEVARRVGKSRSTIANTVRLLQLPPPVQRLVAEGQLSAGHARALLGSSDSSFQQELAQLAVDEELTVREVEDLVRRQVHGDSSDADGADEPPPSPEAPKAVPGTTKAPALLELEGLLGDHLDTRVSVSMSANRGRIQIEFATVEDLERIYGVITRGTPKDRAGKRSSSK